MEDDLKISKMEYLNNHVFYPPKMLYLRFDDQTILYKIFIWRQPPTEDNLQWKTTSDGRRPPMEDYLILSKEEYLSKSLLYHSLILTLS